MLGVPAARSREAVSESVSEKERGETALDDPRSTEKNGMDIADTAAPAVMTRERERGYALYCHSAICSIHTDARSMEKVSDSLFSRSVNLSVFIDVIPSEISLHTMPWLQNAVDFKPKFRFKLQNQ